MSAVPVLIIPALVVSLAENEFYKFCYKTIYNRLFGFAVILNRKYSARKMLLLITL